MVIAAFELVLAAVFWGFGFPASIWALESFSAPAITAMRFGLTILLAFAFGMVRPQRLFSEVDRTLLKTSFLPGVYLAGMLILQTWGLAFTTATKSSFITCLYAIMVPLFITFSGRARFHWSLWVWTTTALLGMGFMLDFSMSALNFGDVVTFFCAIFSSLHILQVGKIAAQVDKPYLFNVYQAFWAGLVSVAALPLFPGPHITEITPLAIGGLASLTVLSTFLGFAIQVKTQKIISESHASLIFLLESPFALIFAVFLLAEQPSHLQLIGCAVIFLSAFASTVFETRRMR